ncbi:MAG: hypothetical protein IJI20_02270, partial [Firmicutes bacterium]|nr:hypothetical protein [Bacillota bacterium]
PQKKKLQRFEEFSRCSFFVVRRPDRPVILTPLLFLYFPSDASEVTDSSQPEPPDISRFDANSEFLVIILISAD